MRCPALVFAALLLLCGCGSAASAPARPAAGAGPLFSDGAIFTAVSDLLGRGGPVDVEMYEFGRADLAERLAALAGGGARVRLILDPTVAVSAQTGSRLAARAVQVRWYPDDPARSQIDHVKLLLAGGQALVGGMNWGAGSHRNHDYALELAGPAVAQAEAVFEQDWALSGGAAPGPAADLRGPIAQTAPGAGVRHLVEDLLARRGALAMEMFALSDPAVLAALAAHARRGDAVRVLLDPGQSVNRDSARLLAGSGVAVRYARPARGAKLHAKAAAAAGRLLLGSANWTQHGLGVNHELDAATDEPAVVAAFQARFEADWSAAA